MAKRKYSDSDREKIIALLEDQPQLEAAQIAARLGLNENSTRQHMWHLLKSGRVTREVVRWLRRPKMGSTPVYGYVAVPTQNRPETKVRQPMPGSVRVLILQLMADEKGRTAHEIAELIQHPINRVTSVLSAMRSSGELLREFLGEKNDRGMPVATYSYNCPHIARVMAPEEVIRSAIQTRSPLEMAWR